VTSIGAFSPLESDVIEGVNWIILLVVGLEYLSVFGLHLLSRECNSLYLHLLLNSNFGLGNLGHCSSEYIYIFDHIIINYG